MATFGQKVREYRELHGWTQAELGIHSGFSRTSITNIERDNQNPPLDAVYALADALGIPVASLFDGSEINSDLRWRLLRDLTEARRARTAAVDELRRLRQHLNEIIQTLER